MSDAIKACKCTDGNCKCYETKSKRIKIRVGSAGVGWLGFWAYIGAAVYFVSKANGFWDGVLGLLKALVWPAFLVYQGLTGTHV